MNSDFFPVPSPWFRHSVMLKSLMHCTYSVKKNVKDGQFVHMSHGLSFIWEGKPYVCKELTWFLWTHRLHSLSQGARLLLEQCLNLLCLFFREFIARATAFMCCRKRRVKQCSKCAHRNKQTLHDDAEGETILSCSCRRGRYRLTEKMEIIVCF